MSLPYRRTKSSRTQLVEEENLVASTATVQVTLEQPNIVRTKSPDKRSPARTKRTPSTPTMGRRSIRDKDRDKDKLKRAPSKHRWLLTRKTWRYMADAGRRLIPEGAHNNKPEDIPKIEEYFQEVCRNESKFLLWRRKSSYPGALSSLRRKKHGSRGFGGGRKLFGSPTTGSSADEADDDSFGGRLGGARRSRGKGSSEDTNTAKPNKEFQLIINMLEKFLNIEDHETPTDSEIPLISKASAAKLSSAQQSPTQLSPTLLSPDQLSPDLSSDQFSPELLSPEQYQQQQQKFPFQQLSSGPSRRTSSSASEKTVGFVLGTFYDKKASGKPDGLTAPTGQLSLTATPPNSKAGFIQTSTSAAQAALQNISLQNSKKRATFLSTQEPRPPTETTSQSILVNRTQQFKQTSRATRPTSINLSGTSSSGFTTTRTPDLTKSSVQEQSIWHPGNFNPEIHSSLLLDSLKQYRKKNYSPFLSQDLITADMLRDKQLLRKILNDIKQQQQFKLLRQDSRCSLNIPFSNSSSSLTSMIFRHHGYSGRDEGGKTFLQSIAHSVGWDENKSGKIIEEAGTSHALNSSCPSTASTPTGHVPLIAIKGASQEAPKLLDWGIQTEPVPKQQLQQLLNAYRKKCEEEELMEKLEAQEQKEQEEAAMKTNRRKSSIDNEDVSQSVSDTIKRYLRMARKKTSNADAANRFKRINYDRNLRNIKPKGEITMPGDDDGTSKGCQTDESWIAALFKDSRQLIHVATFVPENSPTPTPSTTPVPSTPPSPSPTIHSSHSSGILHSSTQFLTNLFHHASGSQQHQQAAQHGGTASPSNNMQKSKSSSNVGHLVSKKIWKSRSKSQIRAQQVAAAAAAVSNMIIPPPGSAFGPDGLPLKSQWTPQGKCVWTTNYGHQVQLTDAELHELTDIERKLLHKVAIDKLYQLNLGVNITSPTDDAQTNTTATTQPKPQKRRALLLKRKALTTGLFDSSKNTPKDSELLTGLVFGILIEQCIENDNQRLNKSNIGSVNVGTTGERHNSSRSARSSLSSLIDHQQRDKSGSCESLPSKTNTFGAGEMDSNSGYLSSMSLSQMEMARRCSQDEEDLLAGYAEVAGIRRQTQRQVPSVIITCIKYLEEYGMHQVGIFRVSTSKKRVRQLREDFDQGRSPQLDSDISPHDIATLLKEYLRDLPEPLLCRSLYQAFVKTQTIRNRRLQLEALSHLVQLLPVAHRDTLYELLKFLAKVARCADDLTTQDGQVLKVGNKMDSNNLATVFAPNILHCIPIDRMQQLTTDQEIEERLDVINVIRTMIDHYEELFIIAAELIDEIYTNMMDTYPQQLDYLCDRRDLMGKQVDDEVDSSETSVPPLSPPPNFTMRNSMGSIQQRTSISDDERNMQRRYYSREDFLHENAAMGGPNISMRRMKERASMSGTIVLNQKTTMTSEPQYHRMRILSTDMDKATRRRRRSDKTDYSGAGGDTSSSSSTRGSFGSGYPHINDQMLRHVSTDESIITGTSSTTTSPTPTTTPTMKTRSSSIDSNSSLIESPTRRLSSPFILNNVGVLTASLKIPVQVQASNSYNNYYTQNSDTASSGYLSSATTVIPNIGDDILDIPYIEEGECNSPASDMATRTPDAFVVRRSSKILTSGSKSRAVFRRNIESTAEGSSQIPDAFTYQYENAPSSVSSPDSLKSPPPQFFDDDHMFAMRSSFSASSILGMPGMISSVVSSLVSPSNKVQKSTTTPAVSTTQAAQSKSKMTKKSLIPGLTSTTSALKNTTTSRLFTSSSTTANSSGSIISSSAKQSEPKLSGGITNIGGAVMRSKTADFERMMSTKNQVSSAKNGNNQNQSEPSTNNSSGGPTTTNNTISTSASGAGRGLVDSSGRKNPIYKRQEIISSTSSGTQKTLKKSK